MRQILTALAALIIATGLLVSGGSPASAHNGDACSLNVSGHPVWGCASVTGYSNRSVNVTIDDAYVSATWPTPQSSVSECTYVAVERHSTGVFNWSNSWRDCGGSVNQVSISTSYDIGDVRIYSKDSRGRWRYSTIQHIN